jgi:HK97 gp10 family phage protein
MAEGPVVVGLGDLRRALAGVGADAAGELRAALLAGARVVAADAVRRAPRRTGRLAASVRAGTDRRGALVRAGNDSTVPYAGVIHYGWPARHIAPQPFLDDAVRASAEEVVRRAADALDRLIARHFPS